MKILFMAWSIYDDTGTLPQFCKHCTGGDLVIKKICEYVGKKNESYLFIGKCKIPRMDLGNIHIVGTEKQNIEFISNEQRLHAMASAFEDALDEIKPDIVNIHGLGVLAKKCIEICILKNIPYVYTEHLYIGIEQKIQGYDTSIEWEKDLYSIPDLKMITVSTGMKRKILKDFPQISEENISVILNGTDFSAQKLDSDLKQRYSLYDKKVLLCVGTVLDRKNQIQAVDAFCMLPRQLREKIKILFCGVDGMEGRLQNKIFEMGMQDELIYVGSLSNKEMKEYYSIADGLVVPSKAEGLSIAMLETIAYGLPIVMFSDSECAEDLNDEKVVCFADDRSSQGLAEAMERWYHRVWDHNYIMQYSKYFSMERMAEDYIKYYKSRLLS